jgi:hypothetical protein
MAGRVRYKDSNMARPMDQSCTIKETTATKRRGRIRWVSQLMIPGMKEWDVQLLYSIFHKFDAKEILKIRLWEGSHDDFIGWFDKKFGMFSVRSAYL